MASPITIIFRFFPGEKARRIHFNKLTIAITIMNQVTKLLYRIKKHPEEKMLIKLALAA